MSISKEALLPGSCPQNLDIITYLYLIGCDLIYYITIYRLRIHLQPGCIHVFRYMEFFTLIPAVVRYVGTTL